MKSEISGSTSLTEGCSSSEVLKIFAEPPNLAKPPNKGTTDGRPSLSQRRAMKENTPLIPVAATPAALSPAYSAVDGVPHKRWRAGLCDCCRSCCTCVAGWCCYCIFIPQMWQRVFGEAGSCLKWSIILWSLWSAHVLFNVLGPICNIFHISIFNLEIFEVGIIHLTLVELVGIANMSLIAYLVCTTRSKVREVDGIPAECCVTDPMGCCTNARGVDGRQLPGTNACEDCCCGFWCSCCTSIQIANHTRAGTAYSLTSPTGWDTSSAPGPPVLTVMTGRTLLDKVL